MPGDLNSNLREAVNFVLLQNKKRPKWPKKIENVYSDPKVSLCSEGASGL
jgi:hypothetical protein